MAVNKRERILTVIVALGILVLVLDRFVLTPMVAQWRNYGVEAVELRGKRDQYALLLANRDAYNAYARDMEANALPSDASEAQSVVVNKISAWASESGLKLESVNPTVTAPTRGRKNPLIRVRLTGQGDLKAVCTFIHMAETSKTPVTTRRLDVKSRKDDGSALDLVADLEAILPGREVAK